METYFHLKNGLTYRLNKNQLGECTCPEAIRYLKCIYTNESQFQERYLRSISKIPELKQLYTYLSKNYDAANPYTLKEAFQIESLGFRRMVFGSIDISEMIRNLGATRIQVAGKKVIRKQYDSLGNNKSDKTYDVIFETYVVNGALLGIERDLYAVKCWCTTTHKENWLWIEKKYKDDPLAAIASTFRFHENVIPYIKELKRQGDVMLVEMKKEVRPEGEIIPLTADQYFNLLTAES
jgi:hypothetical protein